MSLEVIVGCMYSGKTEELVRRLRRASIAGQMVRAFKPALDARYHESDLSTHLGNRFEAEPVRDADELRDLVAAEDSLQVVGFDEAQFMGPGIIPLLEALANLKIRVVVAGLDMDYQGKPFGPIPHLLAVADSITKLHAVCVAKTPDGHLCGNPASRSFRLPEADSGAQVQVGSEGVYEARCRACWYWGQG